MCLDAISKIVESGVVIDFASHHATWHIRYSRRNCQLHCPYLHCLVVAISSEGVPRESLLPVRDQVPFAVVLFSSGKVRSLGNKFAINDEWVQINHELVIVESILGRLPRYSRRERSYRGEDRLFRHCDRGSKDLKSRGTYSRVYQCTERSQTSSGG